MTEEAKPEADIRISPEDAAAIKKAVADLKKSEKKTQDREEPEAPKTEIEKIKDELARLRKEKRDSLLAVLPKDLQEKHAESSLSVLEALADYAKAHPPDKGALKVPKEKGEESPPEGYIGGFNTKTGKWE